MKFPRLYPLVKPVLKFFSSQSDKRFVGLTDMMHRCDLSDMLRKNVKINIEELKENPPNYLELRKNLESRCREFIANS
jgi:hypothetical protein